MPLQINTTLLNKNRSTVPSGAYIRFDTGFNYLATEMKFQFYIWVDQAAFLAEGENIRTFEIPDTEIFMPITPADFAQLSPTFVMQKAQLALSTYVPIQFIQIIP